MPAILLTRWNLDFTEVAFSRELPGNCEIVLDGIFDVGESLLLGLCLRPAARQSRTRYAIAFFVCARATGIFS